MSIFSRGENAPGLPEAIQTFKELAQPFVSAGDLGGVNQLYRQVYAQAMKGRKKQPLEEMRAQAAMKQALQEALTRTARERRHYFDAYRHPWWRNP